METLPVLELTANSSSCLFHHSSGRNVLRARWSARKWVPSTRSQSSKFGQRDSVLKPIRPATCSNDPSVSQNSSVQVEQPLVPTSESSDAAASPALNTPGKRSPATAKPRRAADSTDWIASAVTRRFGIAGGLAWVGFLAFGVISEQVKTRTEVFLEESNTRDVEDAPEVFLDNGIRYQDFRVGGGARPLKGDLVVLSLVGKVAGSDVTFVDTTAPGKRDIVFAFDVRPYVSGVCDGLEIAMASMRAGGKRRIVVPPSLGFGDSGAAFVDGTLVPGGAFLEYLVELKRVSIAPS